MFLNPKCSASMLWLINAVDDRSLLIDSSIYATSSRIYTRMFFRESAMPYVMLAFSSSLLDTLISNAAPSKG